MTSKTIPETEIGDSVTTNDSTDEYIYRCPHCEAGYTDERLLRVHITRADDPTHQHRHGLMPEEEIEVVDSDGNVADTCSKRPEEIDLTDVEINDFPSDLSDKRAHALVVATHHPDIDNRSELSRMVNEHVENTDIGISPPSEQTVRRALDEFYHPHRSDTVKFEDNDETLDDLTPTQQAIIIAELVLSDEPNTGIADRIGCASSYPGQINDRKANVLNQLETRIEQGEGIETVLTDELSAGSFSALVEDNLLSEVPLDLYTVASKMCSSDDIEGELITDGNVDAVSENVTDESQWGSPIENTTNMSAGPDDSILSSDVEKSNESSGTSETLEVSDSSGTISSTPSDGCDEGTGSIIDESYGDEIATSENETLSSSGDTEIVADIETLRAKVAFFRQTLDPVDDRNGETALIESFAKQVERDCERMLQHEGNA